MSKNIFKERALRIRWMLMALLCCCFTGCSDDDEGGTAAPYDPNQPVTVTDFSPKSAAYGEDIVIYGTNFGNDVSRVKVTIGGKNAKVIGVKNTIMYCVVPQSAYGNEIQVEITDGGENILASAVCESAEFTYAKSWLVTTEIGTHYETSNDEMEIDGRVCQRGDTSQMLYTVDEIISHVSQYMTLRIGDLIYTGTPAGVGPVHEGQTLRASLEGQTLLDFDIR